VHWLKVYWEALLLIPEMEDDGHLLQDITAAEEHARESTEYESSIRLLSNVGSAYLNTWIGAQLSLPLKLLRVLN